MLQTVCSTSSAPGTTPKVAAVSLLGDRLKNFAATQLQQARAHLSRQGEARHGGIHEARKCLRRARATLALARDALGPGAAPLDLELQRVCRGLSMLRDGQALIEALHRLDGDAEACDATVSSALAAAALRRDEMLTKSLARDADFKARRRRLERVEACLVRLDWASLRYEDVRRAMSRSERRMQKANHRAQQHRESDRAWHKARRRLRRFRQQTALLTEIEPTLARTSEKVEQRATALGALQDDALLLARCGRHSPFPPNIRSELRRIARRRVKHTRVISGE